MSKRLKLTIVGAVLLLSAMLLGGQQLINGYRVFANIVAANVTTPSSGSTAVYVDSVTKKLATRDDAGTVTNYGSGGGTGNMSTTSVNTMGAAGTIDASATAVNGGLVLPQGSGAAPTGNGNIAYDNTTETIRCGDGTNTNHCIEVPYLATANATSAAAGTNYNVPSGSSSFSTSATTREQLLPYGGFARNLCVVTTSAQPGTGNLVVTLRDNTAGSDTALTITVNASQAGSTTPTCDTTDVVAITANHLYTLEFVDNASTSSANVAGYSWTYRY